MLSVTDKPFLLSFVMLNVVMLSVECRYAECRAALGPVL